MNQPLYGAIEGGGTKFLVAVGEDPLQPCDVQRIPTSNHPEETMQAVIDYFRSHPPLAGLGMASFGPVDFPAGAIGMTPKLAWQRYPLVERLSSALGTKVFLETDVNGAAIGEALFGAGRGLDSFVYITVGTGIGGGVVINGQPLHGLLHPEIGHLPMRLHPNEPAGFAGVCPFHGDCLEGLASGPAMHARWNQAAETLPPEHPGWPIEAYYLAQACLSLACTLSPRRIVLGGGVPAHEPLIHMIRTELARQCNGYLPLPDVVPPKLPLPAISGALALAAR